MKFWAPRFKRGRKRAWETMNVRNVQKLETVLDDRWIKIRKIREVRKTLKEHLCHILNQNLHMRKLYVHWVPHLITLDQKRVRMNFSIALLAQFRRNKSKFWCWSLTVDEAWIRHYTPETKMPSEQWTAKWELAPKNWRQNLRQNSRQCSFEKCLFV